MNALTVSANEFAVTIRKSCIGAGVARGVAEDIATGALAAAARGLIVLPPLLDALDAFCPKSADWERTAGGWVAERATALNDAPSVVDLASTGAHVSISTFDQPVLLLGCALAAQEPFAVRFGVEDWQDCGSISQQPNGPCAIHLRLAATAETAANPAALTVMQNDWQALEAYAQALLVPADDTTRGDAGAGTDDND